MRPQLKFYAHVLTACVLTPAASLAQPSAALKPITHEALWMMKRVGAPVASPDGKWVVYSVLEPSYDTEKAVSDLWLVPADGSKAPRRITNTKAPEGGVAWSADSSSIAFTTKRETDEAEQVYILNLAEGGEARRLTSISTGASNPKWRPDGKAILFESFVYPNATDDEANKKIAADRKARKYNVRTYEHFPIRFWNQWLDDRQPTLMVQSVEPGSQPKDLLSATALARTSGYSGSETDSGVTLAPLWSPDGREVVFTATTEHWNAAFAQVGYHLYRMAADGGEPRIVSPASGEYVEASFSPNGKSLFFKYELQDSEVYHLPRLYKVPWPAGGEADARGTRLRPGSCALCTDAGRQAGLPAGTGCRKGKSLSSCSGRRQTRLGYRARHRRLYLARDPAERRRSPFSSPPTAARSTPQKSCASILRGARIVNLTQVNTAAAAAIDWQPPQHFYFTSAKGRNIHNMIVLPPAFDSTKKYPHAGSDPRRGGEQQPGSDRVALELPSVGGTRLRHLDDGLHGLDQLRREIRAGHQAGSFENTWR